MSRMDFISKEIQRRKRRIEIRNVKPCLISDVGIVAAFQHRGSTYIVLGWESDWIYVLELAELEFLYLNCCAQEAMFLGDYEDHWRRTADGCTYKAWASESQPEWKKGDIIIEFQCKSVYSCEHVEEPPDQIESS